MMAVKTNEHISDYTFAEAKTEETELFDFYEDSVYVGVDSLENLQLQLIKIQTRIDAIKASRLQLAGVTVF